MLPRQVGPEFRRTILGYRSGPRQDLSSSNHRRVSTPQNLECIQPKKILHMKGARAR
ncbi:hypothetical protein B296_00019780 [Ensete ventricosum]|uniref:Uncharacterized protein n=1 Tax=Ensete ventricosum TaxID=4639 RepID=A0A426YUQ1_ENSVE|nr:hypothetical protein B296_00019780 [Ensete ventricosum]